jgi:ACS family glucarate transporter-like MFS transporter
VGASARPGPEGPDKIGRITAVRWRVCALMTLAGFVAYLLRTNMSVAGAPMAAELGLTHVQLGIILGGFAWGYTIFQLPGGVLGDRLGPRRSIAAMAVAWAGLNLLVGLTPAETVGFTVVVVGGLTALRFLMGAAQAPLFPVIGGGALCNWFPVSGWALPNAMQNVGLTFGAAATGPVIAWLSGTVGWRASFGLTAPAGLVLAGLWWWYVRDRPEQHSLVSPAEVELIRAGRDARPPAPAGPGVWRLVLRNRQVRLLTAGYFCATYVFNFFFNWLFLYLIESRGFRLLEGGWYAAAPWIAGAAGAFFGGWLCDRLWRRIGARWSCRSVGVSGLAMTALCLLVAASASHPVAAVAWLSLCLASQQMTDAVYWAGAISVAGPRASVACGVMNTGGNISGGVGALLVPILVDRFGWGPALASGALFAVTGAALWLVTAVDRPMTESLGSPPAEAFV